MGITEIQKLIRDYYEQLYTKKLEIPEEMGKFLVTFNLPRRNLKEIESSNIPKWVTSLNSSKKSANKENSRTWWPHCLILPNFNGGIYTNSQTIPISRRQNSSKSFYDVSIALIPIRKELNKKGKLQANIFNEDRQKSSQQNSRKPNTTVHQKVIYHDKVGLIPGMQD